MRVAIEQEAMTVEVLSGDPVEFSVRGAEQLVAAGETRSIALEGQGPRLVGKPTLRSVTQNVREDGTPLTASIPLPSALDIPELD
jgi:alpha,alpha-trehalose phosphorylase